MSDAAPQTWDPQPHKREWYSHRHTGDRGWKVIRDGIDCVKLDRPNQDLTRPFIEGEWAKEESTRRMIASDMAQICHAADQALCLRAQLYAEPRPDWRDLTDKQKQRWFNEGPKHPLRAKLFAAIQSVLHEEVG